MDAKKRREQIFKRIESENGPISATKLANFFNVSRQVIVGDVAILRASGHEIIATARGYILQNQSLTNKYVNKIVCRHDAQSTIDELYLFVDLGAEVLNVIVDHEIYGELTGTLGLSTRHDVDEFIKRLNETDLRLLSELTNGIHIHTISCRNKDHYQEVELTLQEKGFLY